MDRAPLTISRLDRQTPALALCASWRYEEFFRDTDVTLEESLRQLLEIADARDGETALLAQVRQVPAGICLFVHDEIDPAHDLGPWLASLYVVPEFRRRGIATALVAAIEDHARRLCVNRLYLYTIGAEGFYRRRGWTVAERFDWHGDALVLMHRDL